MAAFIILCFMSVFVGFLSIFRRDLGRKYWKIFKKAWGCVWTKVRLQKCESNFKDEIKNSILKHFVLKRPKLVKPISVGIEVLAVLIVVISGWSLVEGAKAGLGLAVLGTCNVSTPSSCSLGAEACTVDRGEPKNVIEGMGRWLEEWGEIFAAVPDRLKHWEARDYLPIEMPAVVEAYRGAPVALDIIDPLCSSCRQTFINQRDGKFFEKYNVYMLFYAITLENGEAKFKNSDVIVRYLHAATRHDNAVGVGVRDSTAMKMIRRIFTEYNAEKVNYQDFLAKEVDGAGARKVLEVWLREFGKSEAEVEKIREIAEGDVVEKYIKRVDAVVRKEIRVRGIPTLIFDGRKHFGVWKK